MGRKLYHNDLVKLGQELGYTLDDEGLCRGFTGSLSQAWLGKDQAQLAKDEATFFKRLEFIEGYDKDFKRLKKDIESARQQAKLISFDERDEKIQTLLEIPAWYEVEELYLNPSQHADLLASNKATQDNIGLIYPFTRSKQLEQDKTEVSIGLDKPYLFDKKGLKEYLKDLEQVFKGSGEVAPIILSNARHAVSLRYDPQNKNWVYVDTNDFERYRKDASYRRELDSDSLADSIFGSFFAEKHPCTFFYTTVLIKSSQEVLKEALDKLDKKYPINSELVKRYDRNGIGMLYAACRHGLFDTVCELLKQEGIDVNKASNNGVTPLYKACQSSSSR